MASSTAPCMLAMLFGIFTSAFGETQVLYGDNAREAERENLVLTGVVDYDEESWLNLGAQKRREVYRLDGFLQYRVPGSNVQEAVEGAYALGATVEEQLRPLVGPSGYATVSAALLVAFPDGSAQLTDIEFKPKDTRPFPIDEGVGCQIDFAIEVVARI